MQAGALAIAVLGATAGGFAVLSNAFDEDDRGVGESPGPVTLPANGEIVFSAQGNDGYAHLYAIQPGGPGRRQITDFGTNDTDPAVSPDGKTIAFVHQLEDVSPAIATIPIDGGTVTWLTDPELVASDPTWSPDGSEIAFVVDATALYIASSNGQDARSVIADIGFEIADPSWSPDGSRIVFASRAVDGTSGLATVRPDGSDLEHIETNGEAAAPAWSPDGSMIAYVAFDPDSSHQIRFMSPEGTSVGMPFGIERASLGEIDWSPDGRFLAFLSDLALNDSDQDGDLDIWTMRSLGNENSLTNLTTEGVSGIAWQPQPTGVATPDPEASPEPEPSPTQNPRPEKAEIGLPFLLCHATRLGGVDFLGDGAAGIAWVGVRAREDGSCPQQVESEAIVAADFNGDEFADSWWGGIEYCLFCMPWDATDLDADGDEELVVLEGSSSTPSFLVLTAQRDPTGQPELRPVGVAPPGHDVARLAASEPLRIVTGGDEGFSGWVRCEGFPAAPVLVLTWRDHPIEGETMEVHETKLVLREDGAAHIIETDDHSAPVGTPIPGVSDAPACGVDWQILG